jgi:hypothetical protein
MSTGDNNNITDIDQVGNQGKSGQELMLISSPSLISRRSLFYAGGGYLVGGVSPLLLSNSAYAAYGKGNLLRWFGRAAKAAGLIIVGEFVNIQNISFQSLILAQLAKLSKSKTEGELGDKIKSALNNMAGNGFTQPDSNLVTTSPVPGVKNAPTNPMPFPEGVGKLPGAEPMVAHAAQSPSGIEGCMAVHNLAAIRKNPNVHTPMIEGATITSIPKVHDDFKDYLANESGYNEGHFQALTRSLCFPTRVLMKPDYNGPMNIKDGYSSPEIYETQAGVVHVFHRPMNKSFDGKALIGEVRLDMYLKNADIERVLMKSLEKMTKNAIETANKRLKNHELGAEEQYRLELSSKAESDLQKDGKLTRYYNIAQIL